MVFSVALRMLNDVGSAEDMVQETFLQAWTKLSDYEESKAAFSTWLYTIINRKCIDQIRRSTNDTTTTQVNWDHLFENSDSLSEEIFYDTYLNANIIKQLSASLSPMQKSVFVLRDLEGMDIEEVRQITGLSVNQIKDNLYLARKSLRNKFESLKKLQDHER